MSKRIRDEVIEDVLTFKKHKSEPVSLEELVEKKKKAAAEKSKPVFLTREQREKLALEERAREVEEAKKKKAEAEAARKDFLKDIDRESERDRERDRRDRERDRDRGGDRRGDRDRDRRDRERDRERERERERRERERERAKKAEKEKEKVELLVGREGREQEKELEEIKKHYLGLKEKKKRVIKPSEKYQRVFNWDNSDDTSSDFNAIYSNRLEYKPAFGKGFIAGIDFQDQAEQFKKTAKKTDKDDHLSRNLDYKWQQKSLFDKHWKEKTRQEMTERDWRIFKEDHNITARGGGIPNPIRSWKESNLPPHILDAIALAGYKAPTAIQMQAIPIAIEGRDIIGVAQTGSGKTAAFLIPMLIYISKLPPMTTETKVDGPYALIMAPTRELVLQIEGECQKFCEHTNIRTISLVGGQSIEDQAFMLEQGCEVIIATPGRMIDCLNSRYAVLNQCNYVVMDEADKMIDMGFEGQVNQILASMPSSNLKSENEEEAALQEKSQEKIYRTTIMYSATMPPGVEKLARAYLRRPAYVAIGEVGKTVDRIDQRVMFVKNENDKRNRLLEVLNEGPPPPIIIFVNKKKNCDSVAKFLDKESNYSACVLHSSKTQEQREYALESFRSGKFGILVATDVAGRGLDVKGVTHVINYDMPKSIDYYTHRVGRTGRMGEKGMATSFLTNDDTHIMYDLKNMLLSSKCIVPSELSKHPAAQFKPGQIVDKRRETIYTH